MGGKLITTAFGLPEKRLTAREYFELSTTVKYKLRWNIPASTRVAIIPAYRKKESFGDLDILIEFSPYIDYKAMIKELFGFDKPHHNAGVWSFPYDGFQVDLIIVPSNLFDIAKTYYSWNDCGNLCGRVFHSLGMSYGHEGLYYIIREETIGVVESDNSHVLKEVLLSTDPKEILEFGGFNYEKFKDGFDTLEEMFDWVCKSPFFNPDKYQFENLNHINRTRNRKRKSYAYFVEWLKTNKQKYGSYEGKEKKLEYLPWIIAKFPKLQVELDAAKKSWEEKQAVRAKFNGDLIFEWTGIDRGRGVEIGRIMHSFRSDKSIDQTFTEYTTAHTAEEIKKDFLEWHELYKGKHLQIAGKNG